MPAVTGLSQLGDALLKGSGDYANIKLRKQREDEARAQMLADLADQRRYSEGQNQQSRMNRIEDATKVAQFNSRFDALQRAMKLGLIAATDIGNIAIEDMALKALSQREAAEDKLKQDNRIKAQARVDKNAVLAKDIMDKIAADERVANSTPEINPRELQAMQETMARAAKGGKGQISQSDIDGQYNAAMEKLQQDVMIKWSQKVQEAKINAANNKMLLRGLADENNQLTQLYGVIGDVPRTLAEPAPSAGVAPAFSDPMAAFKRTQQAPPPDTAQPMPALADPGYGGVRGALGTIGNEFSSVLNNAKLAINKPLTVLGRGYDSIMGGDKAVLEGEPARNQRLAGLVQNYNQTAGAPISFEQAAVPLAPRLQDPNAPKPLTYEQFLQFQDQLKKPLPTLKPLRTPPPSSVFSYPDPYGLVGN